MIRVADREDRGYEETKAGEGVGGDGFNGGFWR